MAELNYKLTELEEAFVPKAFSGRKSTMLDKISTELSGWTNFSKMIARDHLLPTAESALTRSTEFVNAHAPDVIRGIETLAADFIVPCSSSLLKAAITTANALGKGIGLGFASILSGVTKNAADNLNKVFPSMGPSVKNLDKMVQIGVEAFNEGFPAGVGALEKIELGLVDHVAQPLASSAIHAAACLAIEGPSVCIEAGRAAVNFAFSVLDSAKCGYEYVSEFMGVEVLDDSSANEEGVCS